MPAQQPLFVAGKPRYWCSGYDFRHLLLLPPMAAVLVTALFVFSRPARTGSPPSTGGPASQRPAQFVGPMAPTVLQSPYAGAIMMQERLGTVEGTAEPRSVVRLYLGRKLLGESATDVQGRFRFQLTNFPAGQHRMRAEAWSGGRSVTSEEVVFTVVADSKQKNATSPKRPRPAPVKK